MEEALRPTGMRATQVAVLDAVGWASGRRLSIKSAGDFAQNGKGRHGPDAQSQAASRSKGLVSSTRKGPPPQTAVLGSNGARRGKAALLEALP